MIYSLRNRTTNVTIANAALELRTASTKRARLMELHIFMAAATASVFGVGRPQAIGITPTTPVNLLPEDSVDPTSTCTTALAWATGPTVPLNFFRVANLPATIGAANIFTFPRGLIIPVSSSIVVWNITGTGVADVVVVVDE